MTSLDIIIRIAHRLDELDKSEWFIPVLKWLSAYEGPVSYTHLDVYKRQAWFHILINHYVSTLLNKLNDDFACIRI